MTEKKTKKKTHGHLVDVAALRRRSKAGQLHHNLENPVEEGAPVNQPEAKEIAMQEESLAPVVFR